MAGGISVDINEAAVRRMLSDPAGMTGRFMYQLGQRVRTRAVLNCPVRTGRLRSSIQMTLTSAPPSSVEFNVGTNVEYAYWVHEGRGPVRPVNKKVLHWVGPGGEVFTTYAGPAKGQPFLTDALDAEVGAL